MEENKTLGGNKPDKQDASAAGGGGGNPPAGQNASAAGGGGGNPPAGQNASAAGDGGGNPPAGQNAFAAGDGGGNPPAGQNAFAAGDGGGNPPAGQNAFAAGDGGGNPPAERDIHAAVPAVVNPPVERESPAILPGVGKPQAPTFRDHAGYRLTWGVLIGLFIAIFTFFLVIVFDAPSPTGGVLEAKQLLANCLKPDFDVNQCTDERLALAKMLLDDPAIVSHRQYWKDMFQQIIGTTLLPILTALLGYLFGSGVTARPNDNSGQ